jgi:transcriptional regulator with XRE-family HTH domain
MFKDERATDTLGELIAKYRQRQRQPHHDAPWSQEDLALASETDQAHISRIENDQHHPQYATLVRICDALALSQTERVYVLARAGYPVVRPLPDMNAVRLVSSKLAAVLETYPYPAMLIDDGERIWYLNVLVAKLWGPCYGANDWQGCLTLASGKRTLELIFDPDLHEPLFSTWRSYFEDYGSVLTRNEAYYWRAHQTRPQDPEMTRILSRLKRYPVFLQLWERIERV